jgi:cytochrome c peroxidase
MRALQALISAVLLLALGGATPISAAQTSQNVGKAAPIPKAGWACPGLLKQVGVPIAATRALIPIDNPQTPEKSEPGEKLFSDGRLSADGTVAVQHVSRPGSRVHR